MKLNQRFYHALFTVLTISWILFFYGDILKSPNNYLFTDQGDAIKNYYTYAYHIENDSSYIENEGMNYPYGEHFLYTDCHPLLSSLIKATIPIFPKISKFSVGILNFILILSFFLTAILVYLILIRLKVNSIIAILGTTAIVLLAPQIFRMTGHLALSYSFFVPLTWYLLIRHGESNKKTNWLVLLFFNNIFWFYTHAYMGIMGIFFQTSYWGLSLSQNKQLLRKGSSYLFLVTAICLPIIIFKLFLFLTDNHIGRTDNPSGFFLNNAELDDLLVPHHPPIRPILDQFIPAIKLKWEAWSYIGLTSVVILIYTIYTLIKSLFTKEKNNIIFQMDRRITLAVGASFIVLVFAFGIPFRQFPILLDWFPVFKQFRATGRFTWFFFFCISVFSIYFIHLLFLRLVEKNRKPIAVSMVVIAMGFFIIEAIPYHTANAQTLTKAVNSFDKNQLDSDMQRVLTQINIDKYQAIIPFPFYYFGSESYARPRNSEIVRLTMLLSYHSKLPQVSSYLTRISVLESKKIVQLMSPAYYQKEIEKDITLKKPFLILKSKEPVTEYEKEILSRSSIVFESNSFSLYEITYESLFENTSNRSIALFEQKKEALFEKNGFLVNDTNMFFSHTDFEDNKNEVTFRGVGSFAGQKKGKNTLIEFPPNTFIKGKTYIVSAWMYNNFKDALNLWFRFIVEEYDPIQNTWTSTVVFPEEAETIYGDWSLVELEFSIQDPKNKISIVTIGKDDAKPPFVLDELLIRENHLNVFLELDQKGDSIKTLFKNNHQLIKQSL